MPSLRDLSQEIDQLFTLVHDADGELTPEQEQELDRLSHELATKADAVADVLQHKQDTLDTIRAEEKRLADRRRRLERSMDRFESYVMHCLQAMGRQSVSGPLHTLSMRTAPASLVIDDEQVVATTVPDAVKTEVVQSLDKAAIKKRLLAGEAIPGAHLERRLYLKRD